MYTPMSALNVYTYDVCTEHQCQPIYAFTFWIMRLAYVSVTKCIQRFLCVLVSFRELGLAIELQKVLKDEDGATYPNLVRSEGNTPYYTQPPPKQIEDEPEEAPIPEMEMDMFSGEGPSEAEIERIGKEAEVASKAGLMKAPEVDMSKLKEKSRKKKEERKEDGFEEFNMDDLM